MSYTNYGLPHIYNSTGKQVFFSKAAVVAIAGEYKNFHEVSDTVSAWYNAAQAAGLLAHCPKSRENHINQMDVICTNNNTAAGKRVYRRRTFEAIKGRKIEESFINKMTTEEKGIITTIFDNGVIDCQIKKVNGAWEFVEKEEVREYQQDAEIVEVEAAEPDTAQPTVIILGLSQSDRFGALVASDAIDAMASAQEAAKMIIAEIAEMDSELAQSIEVETGSFSTILTDDWNAQVIARAAIEGVLGRYAKWVVPTTPQAVEIELTPIEGNTTAEPFAIPARSATPSAEPATTQEDTAEPVELPTQKEDATTAEFTQDDKSDDLDHQLTLGSEFVFSIDGRGGAPTTAIIAKLGDGLYRADIAADPNGNYDADAILFLGEQVTAIHYHAIIVSAEAVNNRQPVAEWIRHNELHGADLSSINFSWLDLRGTKINKCNLTSAEFANAQLYGTELRECDLSYTNFSSAKLTGANLSGSNLNSAYFGYASMIEADLSKCDLSFTILKSADLSRANLSGAKLHKTNLSGTDLYRADIIGTLFCKIEPPATPPNFACADLSGSVFKECLGDMILSAAKLDGVTFFDCVVPVDRLFAAESINRPLIVGMMFMNCAYITARRGVFFAIENNGDKRYFLSYTNGIYADFTNIDTGDLKAHAHIVATLDAVLGNQ
jgi:uncharacterized protein YjbI with pentapeptide repeats